MAQIYSYCSFFICTSGCLGAKTDIFTKNTTSEHMMIANKMFFFLFSTRLSSFSPSTVCFPKLDFKQIDFFFSSKFHRICSKSSCFFYVTSFECIWQNRKWIHCRWLFILFFSLQHGFIRCKRDSIWLVFLFSRYQLFWWICL